MMDSFTTIYLFFLRACRVHVKVVGKNKSFKEREKDGILFGETKV